MDIKESAVTKRRSFLAKLGAMLFGASIFGTFTKNYASPAPAPTAASPAVLPSMAFDPLIGSIGIFAGNFVPVGWLLCDGTTYSTGAYSALFSVIGYTYGGSGTSFRVPDLKGRTIIGTGQGTGLTNRALGAYAGTENHTLSSNEMPSHTHTAYGSQTVATSDSPSGLLPAINSEGAQQYASGTTVGMNGGAIGYSGGGVGHNNMPPFLALNYCICCIGSLPERP